MAETKNDERTGSGALGSLRAADGKGVLRIEAHVDAGAGEVWAALTDPARLLRWYGSVEGELRLGGEYRARVHASEWEGTGRVDACEPRRRLLVSGAEPGDPDRSATEVTLTTEGERTVVAVEQWGMPLELLAAFAAGMQVHVEDLAAHLAGQERCDAGARWDELQPGYDDLAERL
jgi:uncharacterized protein YndB with AHSA1/START domain